MNHFEQGSTGSLAEELELILQALKARLRRSETEHVVGYWVGNIIRLDIKGEIRGEE